LNYKANLSKGGLLSDILEIHLLLNGQTNDGRNASYGSLFKTTRYATILLAATSLENFKVHTVEIRGTSYFNLYRLDQVADALRLDYDRTKQAKKIYEELAANSEVKIEVTEDNKTYVSLTEKGIRNCLKKIQELHDLKDYFGRLPPLQQKYTEDELASKPGKGLQSKSNELIEDELKVEMLIKSIAEWG
jgi:hypothetical protein